MRLWKTSSRYKYNVDKESDSTRILQLPCYRLSLTLLCLGHLDNVILSILQLSDVRLSIIRPDFPSLSLHVLLFLSMNLLQGARRNALPPKHSKAS